MDSSKLRSVLRFNAVFSGAGGLAGAVASRPVADAIGVELSAIVLIVGLGLLGFSAFLFWLTRASDAAVMTNAPLVTAADLGWVLGTVGVIALGWVNLTGVIVLAAIALVVGEFAFFQRRAHRRISAERPRQDSNLRHPV